MCTHDGLGLDDAGASIRFNTIVPFLFLLCLEVKLCVKKRFDVVVWFPPFTLLHVRCALRELRTGGALSYHHACPR